MRSGAALDAFLDLLFRRVKAKIQTAVKSSVVSPCRSSTPPADRHAIILSAGEELSIHNGTYELRSTAVSPVKSTFHRKESCRTANHS